MATKPLLHIGGGITSSGPSAEPFEPTSKSTHRNSKDRTNSSKPHSTLPANIQHSIQNEQKRNTRAKNSPKKEAGVRKESSTLDF